MFIKRTLDQYEETKSLNDRYRFGRPRSKRTKEVAKAVREKIHRNPKRLMRQMAKKYQMLKTTIVSFDPSSALMNRSDAI